MSRITITGANGFIGNRLMLRLSGYENSISSIDEDYFNDTDWIVTLLDLLNSQNPEIIFHVGACSDTLEQNVDFMMTRNYESTKIIADWCLERNRKLIYSSSAANYGINLRYPSNLYGWSKYVAEDYVIKSGGIALRYFNVYGPGEHHKRNMASFALQAYLKKVNGEQVNLFPGSPSRDFIYIEDVIDANLHAMNNFEDLCGNFYEVSTSESKTFEDVLDILKIEFKYTSDKFIPQGYQFFTRGNPSKWMTGWRPQYNLVEGLTDYLSYLEERKT